MDPHRLRLKDEFIANRGYWTTLWDQLLEISPEYFEAYMKLSSVPWKTGTLEPKVREFIYIAIDTSTTHLHRQARACICRMQYATVPPSKNSWKCCNSPLCSASIQ